MQKWGRGLFCRGSEQRNRLRQERAEMRDKVARMAVFQERGQHLRFFGGNQRSGNQSMPSGNGAQNLIMPREGLRRPFGASARNLQEALQRENGLLLEDCAGALKPIESQTCFSHLGIWTNQISGNETNIGRGKVVRAMALEFTSWIQKRPLKPKVGQFL